MKDYAVLRDVMVEVGELLDKHGLDYDDLVFVSTTLLGAGLTKIALSGSLKADVKDKGLHKNDKKDSPACR